MENAYLKQVSEFSKAVYYGFVLKKGYFFGKDFAGRPIATSTFVENGKLRLYTKTSSGWEANLISVETAKKLFPEIGQSLVGA